MAFGAGDVGMAAREREMSFGVVVEGGWRPVLRIVAFAAVSFVVFGGELAVVDVAVAGFALLRCACKARGVIGGGFVALRARDGAMRAEKKEFCFGVVEAGYVRPGFCGVAGLAAERGTVGALAAHAVAEFAFVRIGMAGGAGAFGEMKWQNFVGSAGSAEFVALGAGDCGVRAG